MEHTFRENLCLIDTLTTILYNLGIPKGSLHQDTLLHKDLQLDSTETVEIALELKRQLGINVKLETRQDMTLAQLHHLVETAVLANPHKEEKFDPDKL
ncbi:MAG: acyl carrier protein [Desmonostoc geniculatum HA4340-LM1]|jgi:acyl carrier protein|nr:acyl carrier protein [Desmonostoc geniculatum HA4340-LM1]